MWRYTKWAQCVPNMPLCNNLKMQFGSSSMTTVLTLI
jgi:hypothetical protein